MVNLLIDGNHFMMRVFRALPLKEQITQSYILDIWNANLKSLITPFSSIIKRVVFTVDQSSWRKEFSNEIDYKGNRKKDDDTIDWDLLFSNYAEFQKSLVDYGIILHKTPGAEGDDLLYLWQDRLIAAAENCIIVTGDADMRQLIYYDNLAWSIVANMDSSGKRKFYVHPRFIEEYMKEDNDIFNLSQNLVKMKLKESDFYNAMEAVQPELVIITKILAGDMGDNVPPILPRIGEKTAQKIIDNFVLMFSKEELYDILDEGWVKKMTRVIINSSKTAKKHYSASEVKHKLERNRIFVHLHKTHIPSGIINAANNFIDEKWAVKFMGMNSDVVYTPQKMYNISKDIEKYKSVNDFDINNLRF